MSTLKDRITLAIAEKGCTKVDLARAAGAKPPSVSNWLGGQTLTLKAVPASRDAKFLGVEVRSLLGAFRGAAHGRASRQVERQIRAARAAKSRFAMLSAQTVSMNTLRKCHPCRPCRPALRLVDTWQGVEWVLCGDER